jgi:hypothetical protein
MVTRAGTQQQRSQDSHGATGPRMVGNRIVVRYACEYRDDSGN